MLCGRFAAAAAAKLLQSCPTLCDPIDSPGKNPDVGCHFLLQCMKVKSEREISQLCPTLSDPMDCSPAGSSVHGIFQARVLEWGAIAFSGEVCARSKFQVSLWHREAADNVNKAKRSHQERPGASPMVHWSRTCLQCRRCGFHPWAWKILWRREMATHSQHFCWKNLHGQGSLPGYNS